MSWAEMRGCPPHERERGAIREHDDTPAASAPQCKADRTFQSYEQTAHSGRTRNTHILWSSVSFVEINVHTRGQNISRSQNISCANDAQRDFDTNAPPAPPHTHSTVRARIKKMRGLTSVRFPSSPCITEHHREREGQLKSDFQTWSQRDRNSI